ncbi:MAG: hypothetical protein N3B18_08450, partial [Desulfobacterota bacterium]|nr:hypothetical protein [Thermodesulfobacteriota bacterium]
PDGTIICDGTSLYPLKITQRLEQLAPHVRLTTTFEIKRELQSRNAETYRQLQAGKLWVISPALDFVPDEMKQHITVRREPGRILYNVILSQPEGA